MCVAEIVVDIACTGAHLVDYRNKVARCIVREALLDRRTAASRDHVHEHGAVIVVFGIRTVYHLAQTQPILIVCVGNARAALGIGGELLAALRKSAPEVGRRIAHPIIGDGAVFSGAEYVRPMFV